MTRFVLPIVIALVMLLSCSKKDTTQMSFYYWKQTFDLDSVQSDFLERSSGKLYVKYFDIDVENQKLGAVPVARIDFEQIPQSVAEVVPCIYITNRTLKLIKPGNINVLANRIVRLINKINSEAGLNEAQEIQIDCDWTLSTRAIYFDLLNELKTKIGEQVKLSCTIRLHQVKYPKRTGIPPVDKGTLMFYNMGDLNKTDSENTILDLEIASQYTASLKHYPLNLNIALPAYSWGVLLRLGKTTALINNISFAELSNNVKLSLKANNIFEVKESFYLNGTRLYKGDELRLESCKIDLLQESVKLLKSNLKKSPNEIILYHLNKSFTKNYRYEDIEKLISAFN